MKSVIGLRTTALLLGVALGVACSGGESQSPRVLFIGVDGLEWSVAAPMVERGELPNLAALMRRGVYGKIETIDPTLSPVIWTTIATGKVPDKHGIHAFVRVNPDTQEMRLHNRLDRKAKAFWNILSDRGQRVHVVGWFLTYPAEPVGGFMVTQFTTLERATEFWKGSLREDVAHQTYPESFIEEIVPHIRALPDEVATLKPQIFGSSRNGDVGLEARLVEQTLWALEADTLYGGIAEDILRSDPEFDVLAVYFGGPDVTGHRFWRYYRPEEFSFPPSEEQRERFGMVIPGYYRYVDDWIGRLVSACGDGVAVFVVSDHGMAAIGHDVHFETVREVQQMNSAHHEDAERSPGMIVAAGPGIRSGGPEVPSGLRPDALEVLGSVLDVAPTLLYLRGVPVGEDMDGALMETLIDPAFRDRHPLLTVASHEQPGQGPGLDAIDPDLHDEMMERFRSLGYIGGD